MCFSIRLVFELAEKEINVPSLYTQIPKSIFARMSALKIRFDIFKMISVQSVDSRRRKSHRNDVLGDVR